MWKKLHDCEQTNMATFRYYIQHHCERIYESLSVSLSVTKKPGQLTKLYCNWNRTQMHNIDFLCLIIVDYNKSRSCIQVAGSTVIGSTVIGIAVGIRQRYDKGLQILHVVQWALYSVYK